MSRRAIRQVGYDFDHGQTRIKHTGVSTACLAAFPPETGARVVFMTRRPPNPVPTALIVGALGAIALAALAVWFLAINPSDPVAADDFKFIPPDGVDVIGDTGE